MPVPLIAAGIGFAGSLLGNRKTAAEKTMEGTARQQGALASQISNMARQQHTMAGPALNKAMQHYMTLAGGNRAAIQGALAPDMNMMMDSYKGAQMGLERMAPGPQRDRAFAEMQRQKAGQMGMMPFHARQGAIQGLGAMGMDLHQGANNMYGTAGNVLSGQASTNALNANYQKQRQNAWGQLGSNMFNILQPYIFGQGGGMKPIPSRTGPQIFGLPGM